MSTLSCSPPSKRLKLEPLSRTTPNQTFGTYDEKLLNDEETIHEDGSENDHQCSICLQAILDRTVMPTCSHEFCFECLLVWSGVLYVLLSLLEMTYYAMTHRTIKTMPVMLASHRAICYSQH